MPYSTTPADPKAFTVILLIVYIALFFPSLLTFYKHLKSGILGWLSISIFILIRIIGSGLTIHDDNADARSRAAFLVSSIGLSPLLLCTMGVLHEAHSARFPNANKSQIHIPLLIYHILVSTSLGLIITGIIPIISSSSSGVYISPVYIHLARLGLLLLLLCFILLLLFTILAFLPRYRDKYANAYKAGTRLLVAVAIALPFLGARTIYAVVSIWRVFGRTTPPTEAVKLVFATLMEILVVVVLLIMGLVTKDIERARREGEDLGKNGEGAMYIELRE